MEVCQFFGGTPVPTLVCRSHTFQSVCKFSFPAAKCDFPRKVTLNREVRVLESMVTTIPTNNNATRVDAARHMSQSSSSIHLPAATVVQSVRCQLSNVA